MLEVRDGWWKRRVCPGLGMDHMPTPADPVDNLLEPTTQRLQTQMPMAFENEGSLLAGGCILSPRTIPSITEKQNSIVAMSTDFGAISGSKTWF